MENRPGASPDRGRYLHSQPSSYILDCPDRKLPRSLRISLVNPECKHWLDGFECWLSALWTAEDSEASLSPQSLLSSRGSPEFDATQHFLSKASTTIANLNNSKKRYPRSAILPATPRPPRHRRAEINPWLSQGSHLPRFKTSMETRAVYKSPVRDRTQTSIQQGQITPVNSYNTMDLSPSLGANEHSSTPPYESLTPPEIPYGPVYPVLGGEASENCRSRGPEAGGRNSGQSSKSGSSLLDPLQALSDSFSPDSDCHSSHLVPLVISLPKDPLNKTEEIDAWLNELSASVRDDLPSLKVQQAHRLAGKDVNFTTLKQHFIPPSEGPEPLSPKESKVQTPGVRSSSNKENAHPAVLPIPSPTPRDSLIPRLAISSPISPLRSSKNPGPCEDFPQIFPLRPSPKYFPEQVSRDTRVIPNMQPPIRKKPRTGPNSPTKIAPKLQFPILVDQPQTQAETHSPRAGQQFEGMGSKRGGRASSCRREDNALNGFSGMKNGGQGEEVIFVTPVGDKSETWELGAGGGRNRQVLGERRDIKAELARHNYFVEGAEGVKFEFRVWPCRCIIAGGSRRCRIGLDYLKLGAERSSFMTVVSDAVGWMIVVIIILYFYTWLSQIYSGRFFGNNLIRMMKNKTFNLQFFPSNVNSKRQADW